MSAGVIGLQAKTPKQSQVQIELEVLAKAVDGLDGILRDLDNRLQPVLSPQPLEDVQDKEKCENSKVEIASNIASISRKIFELAKSVTSILSRCEL